CFATVFKGEASKNREAIFLQTLSSDCPLKNCEQSEQFLGKRLFTVPTTATLWKLPGFRIVL
ncbi:hypothetical protein, partial [Methanimicrococcus hacksteinii]|uniref:hypothetical protein n=1 Tax=Methanimicrococcus hacksteinii TaxID=3028293 RepID=UPI00298EEA3F